MSGRCDPDSHPDLWPVFAFSFVSDHAFSFFFAGQVRISRRCQGVCFPHSTVAHASLPLFDLSCCADAGCSAFRILAGRSSPLSRCVFVRSLCDLLVQIIFVLDVADCICVLLSFLNTVFYSILLVPFPPPPSFPPMTGVDFVNSVGSDLW